MFQNAVVRRVRRHTDLTHHFKLLTFGWYGTITRPVVQSAALAYNKSVQRLYQGRRLRGMGDMPPIFGQGDDMLHAPPPQKKNH